MAAEKAGGFKMSLGSLKAKAGAKKAAPNPAKRARLDLGDEEPEEPNKEQEISGWDAAEGGAVDANGKKEDKGPRIIPVLPNQNWREEARKQRLERHRQASQQEDEAHAEQQGEQKQQFGLISANKATEEQDTPAEDGDPVEQTEIDDSLTEEQRLEKSAMNALLNGKDENFNVIPIQTEEEAFRNDIRDAPDAPTLEAYEATPIEGFGAAMLRGMGWKDGDNVGKNGSSNKPKEIKRRPALLGIGAKKEAAVDFELGEWGGGKGKNKYAESYNPVMLKNKRTGEMITEEELKTRLESQGLVKDEGPSKKEEKYEEDSQDERRRGRRRKEKKEERDRRRDDDHESERRKDHRDEYESERRRERRKERDEYYDDERRREKRRDRDDNYDRKRDTRRERDDEYDSSDRRREKQRDKDRRGRIESPHDDSRERRRDRDHRDRSRGSDDRRKRRRDYDFEDEREDRKRRHKEDKHYRE